MRSHFSGPIHPLVDGQRKANSQAFGNGISQDGRAAQLSGHDPKEVRNRCSISTADASSTDARSRDG